MPEKLTVPQLIKKLYVFYTTRKFINVFTKARDSSLCWVKLIPPTYSYPIPRRYILILHSLPHTHTHTHSHSHTLTDTDTHTDAHTHTHTQTTVHSVTSVQKPTIRKVQIYNGFAQRSYEELVRAYSRFESIRTEGE